MLKLLNCRKSKTIASNRLRKLHWAMRSNCFLHWFETKTKAQNSLEIVAAFAHCQWRSQYTAMNMWSLCQGPVTKLNDKMPISIDGTWHSRQNWYWNFQKKKTLAFRAPIQYQKKSVRATLKWDPAWNGRSGKTYYNWMQCKWFASIFKLNKIIHVN